MPPPRKAPENSGERADPGDVARYEQLREQVLGGDAGGWRLGLGVLHNRGISGWLRAWDDLPATDPPGPLRPTDRRPRSHWQDQRTWAEVYWAAAVGTEDRSRRGVTSSDRVGQRIRHELSAQVISESGPPPAGSTPRSSSSRPAAAPRPSAPPARPRRAPTRGARCPATPPRQVHELNRRRARLGLHRPDIRHQAALRPSLVRKFGSYEEKNCRPAHRRISPGQIVAQLGIQPALPSRDVGDVAAHRWLILAASAGEVPADRISPGRRGRVRDGGLLPPLRRPAAQAVLAHQPGNPLTGMPPALAAAPRGSAARRTGLWTVCARP